MEAPFAPLVRVAPTNNGVARMAEGARARREREQAQAHEDLAETARLCDEVQAQLWRLTAALAGKGVRVPDGRRSLSRARRGVPGRHDTP